MPNPGTKGFPLPSGLGHSFSEHRFTFLRKVFGFKEVMFEEIYLINFFALLIYIFEKTIQHFKNNKHD